VSGADGKVVPGNGAHGNGADHDVKTSDFVILGAGVMGAAIAFHLARRRAGRIVVIEKDHAGSGGSGRSSALVRMHYSFAAEVQLALISLKIFEQWQEIVGEAGVFRKTGFVRIVHPSEIELLKRNVAMQRSLGARVELIDLGQLRELEPDWCVDDVELAAYEPDSGYGDGNVVAVDFLTRAREMGVTYLPKTRAMGLMADGSRIRGVRTEHGEIHAPVVIVATGPWTRPLCGQAGYDPPIETEFHQVAILKNAPGMKPGAACIDSVTATYFRSDGTDKFLVGDFYGKRPADPDNFPQSASEIELEEIIDRAARRVPKLAHAEVMRGVTGVYDVTPDSRPLLGPVSGVDGLHVCAGFSGMGFKISPAIGLVMAELLIDGRSTTIDITPFRPSRFAEGQPIKAEFEYQDD
jgi:sarcosine oxidase, subunit beta